MCALKERERRQRKGERTEMFLVKLRLQRYVGDRARVMRDTAVRGGENRSIHEVSRCGMERE